MKVRNLSDPSGAPPNEEPEPPAPAHRATEKRDELAPPSFDHLVGGGASKRQKALYHAQLPLSFLRFIHLELFVGPLLTHRAD